MSITITQREKRILWLMDNQELWFNINRNKKQITNRLIYKMKSKGLYAWDTQNVKLEPLLTEAGKRINRELDDMFRWKG